MLFCDADPKEVDPTSVLNEYISKGAIGIGEQKFRVACDSVYLERLAGLAEEFHVPILMHFQHEMYNKHFERFGKVFERLGGTGPLEQGLYASSEMLVDGFLELYRSGILRRKVYRHPGVDSTAARVRTLGR